MADIEYRIAKLPVWAQDEIYGLRRKIAEMTAHAELLSAGPEDSNVVIDDHVYPVRLLGVNTPVEFVLPEGRVIVTHSKGDPDRLEVMAVGTGRKHALAVRPKTGNTIELLLSDY